MSFVLLLLAIFTLGLLLVLIGGILLVVVKSRRAGWIVLGVGLLTTVLTILGFLSLVIASNTMG